MSKCCEDCWYWEYRQQDDANERYGNCELALAGGNEEAYPSARMLLATRGPRHAREICYPELLTRADFYCADFEPSLGEE